MKLTSAIMASLAATVGFAASSAALAVDELHKKHACTACHADDKKLVGPSYKDVAGKYAKDKDAVKKLTDKVRKGGSGVWGPVPMPPNASASDAELDKMVKSILAMAKSTAAAPAKK